MTTLSDALSAYRIFANHPFTKPMEAAISLQSIQTYTRAVRSFFGFLYREGFIKKNPMEGVKLPKVPYKVVPTFSNHEIEKLLCLPDKQSNRGFRDYAIMPPGHTTFHTGDDVRILQESFTISHIKI